MWSQKAPTTNRSSPPVVPAVASPQVEARYSLLTDNVMRRNGMAGEQSLESNEQHNGTSQWKLQAALARHCLHVSVFIIMALFVGWAIYTVLPRHIISLGNSLVSKPSCDDADGAECAFPHLFKKGFEKHLLSPNVTLLYPPLSLVGLSQSAASKISETPYGLFQYLVQASDQRCKPLNNAKPYDPKTCMGSPFIYVTFHGGKGSSRVKNVCKYTRDGCTLGSVLLPGKNISLRNLRGILIHEDKLYVADAYRLDSKLLVYSKCNAFLNNRREPIQELTRFDKLTNPGMIHVYGFAKHSSPYLYASAQGTGEVLRYHLPDGIPGPRSDLLRNTTTDPGVFAKLPKGHEVRGIAFDKQGNLYVADKQKGILIYNQAGQQFDQLDVGTPISIFYNEGRDSIWVGCSKSDTIYEFAVGTSVQLQAISHPLLDHPAGFMAFGDSLYVVSQAAEKLLEFSVLTGKLLAVVLDGLPDVGERVLRSPC